MEMLNSNEGIDGKKMIFDPNEAACQKLIEAAAKTERAEMIAAIREGFADIAAGRTKSARAAINALAKKYGLRL
jgi:hypothetical protein